MIMVIDKGWSIGMPNLRMLLESRYNSYLSNGYMGKTEHFPDLKVTVEFGKGKTTSMRLIVYPA